MEGLIVSFLSPVKAVCARIGGASPFGRPGQRFVEVLNHLGVDVQCIANKTSTRLQSIDVQPSVNEKTGYLDVVFSDAYPIASWVETGVEGSTLAIRLQRPFVTIQDLPKKTE